MHVGLPEDNGSRRLELGNCLLENFEWPLDGLRGHRVTERHEKDGPYRSDDPRERFWVGHPLRLAQLVEGDAEDAAQAKQRKR